MRDLSVEIARFLALQSFNRQRTTYSEVARVVNWSHPYGRGLGNYLHEILTFTHENGLPPLTTILVQGGTSEPPEGAIEYVREFYGDVNVAELQKRVFEFDWSQVTEFAFEVDEKPEIDFDRIYATRVWGFDPHLWGMTPFSHESTRDRILEMMDGKPIFVVYFCSQHSEEIPGKPGKFLIAEKDRARVLGIVEVQPEIASHETHTDPNSVKLMIDQWGDLRWRFGLANSRAWEFTARPMTREVLPHARSTSWEATTSIVELTDEEKDLVRQYSLRELPVYGRELRAVSIAFREPQHTTYLAFCDDPETLRKASAPEGKRLVKIGVSGDTKRRLRELNSNHIAKIFGLEFKMPCCHRWLSQDDAWGAETRALEWAMENTTWASGEYFYMTENEMFQAMSKVKPAKKVR